MTTNLHNGRCAWCGDDSTYIRYHDCEWGRLNTSDRYLFEMLVLEGAQAGLSWICILRKRDGYRRAFLNFDIERVSRMNDDDINALTHNNEIVRNRLKIKSAVNNARCFKAIQAEFGSFDAYVRSFLPNGKPLDNHPASPADIPTHNVISDALSKDMHRRGFRFFGTTICYSFLQATGYINDHLTDCSARKPLQ